ncbi:MAG: sterol desaturase family protein, partial [Betaproteobacteria bacterium]|nr:sterol desaturase family protein [Betaproteobacteria bacterium]
MIEFLGGLLNTLAYVATVYLGFSVIERIAPAERNQPWRPLFFNLLLTPILLGLGGLLVVLLYPLIRDWITAPVGQRFPIDFPKGIAGSILAVMTLIAINDFFYYWWHRWQHTNRWLWAQHALHHSERSLNVCASMRHHWLEDPIRLFVQALPIGFLFAIAPPDV